MFCHSCNLLNVVSPHNCRFQLTYQQSPYGRDANEHPLVFSVGGGRRGGWRRGWNKRRWLSAWDPLSRDPVSRVFSVAPSGPAAPALQIFCAFRHQRGMLPPFRLRRVVCVRNVAVGNVRVYSTHNHGFSHNHINSGDSHSLEHSVVHAHSRTSAGPVSALDPSAFGSASDACKDLVLKRDYESFLTSKFYPNHTQDGFYALKAFYVYTISLLFLLQS